MAESLPVLQAAGVKLLLKTLQMSYDDQNFRYDLPIFVINDPSSYIEETKKTDFESKEVTVSFNDSS
jgi:hypothetical protein